MEKIKKFLQENYPNIQAFNTRNIGGDYTINVYDEDNIQVDYCPGYEYIEIFGLTDEEFKSLLEGCHLKTFSEYEKQNKINLQVGDRVTYRDIIKDKIYILIINDARDLTSKEWIEKQITDGYIEILKIERPRYEVVEEKKELLTEEEKEFLKDMCKYYDVAEIQFGIDLYFFTNENRMIANIKFPKNLQFENTEENRRYSLQELGLEDK